MSEAAILSERMNRTWRETPAPWVCGAAAAALLAASGLGGCASQPRPTAQLVRARTLVSQAEKDEAQRYAAADLQRARDELSGAQTAAADHNYPSALRLADRASVDADLASARASSAKAEQSSEQVHRGLDTLRQQLEQSPAPSQGAGTGATGPGRDQQ